MTFISNKTHIIVARTMFAILFTFLNGTTLLHKVDADNDVTVFLVLDTTTSIISFHAIT